MEDSEKAASEEQQSVVSRVANLPLVSSACWAVSSAYASTKDSAPLLRGVMDAAESGVRTLGATASTYKPLLDLLEPQITVVNDYAMMGLDKMEENLPILHQPADKVVSDTVGLVYQSVTGAKDAVLGAVGAVGVVGAVVGGGERALSSVLGSRVGQMLSSGMNMAVSRSESWVEQHLPLSERELAAVAEPSEGESTSSSPSPSYFVRLGNLSVKVQQRALEQSLVQARDARDATYSALAQISSTLDLLEGARSTLGTAGNQIAGAPEQLLQRWNDWKDGQPGHGQKEAEVDGAWCGASVSRSSQLAVAWCPALRVCRASSRSTWPTHGTRPKNCTLPWATPAP